MVATSHASTQKPAFAKTAGDVRISDLSNDSVIIRLHFTINFLSRWLTPIHNLERLDRAPFRNQPSIKDLLIELRQEERRVFPMLHLMARENNPNLDLLPIPVIDERQAEFDRQRSTLSVMAEIRRLRQSTCSLLRSLTDTGWQRVGTSRSNHDWQIRSLAEYLIAFDEDVLTRLDIALESYGLREGVAEHGRARLFELLKLVPVTTRYDR
jgi:hypothetical protein